LSLFKELKRRNVIKVGIAYVVVAWLVAQVLQLAFESFGTPDWAIKTVLVLLATGLPFALFFSWAYEMTPEGLKRDSESDGIKSGPAPTGNKLHYLITAALALALAYFVYQGRNEKPTLPESTPVASIDKPAEASGNPLTEDASIAVIPFLNLSSDPEQVYFSEGLADTILHMLAQIPEFRVVARTSSFKFKGKNEDIREIAALLGVAMVLEGSVQRQGERVRITVQLIRGKDGSHIWSKVYDDTLDDIFRVQDEIANGVAEAMLSTSKVAGGSSAVPQSAGTKGTGALGGTENIGAYEAFLKGQMSLDEGTPEATNIALVQLQLATELDPGFARAWVELAKAFESSASVGSADWESAGMNMREAAKRAIALEPRLASAYVALVNALSWLDPLDGSAEIRAAILKASELEPNNAYVLEALGWLKIREGKMRESLLLAEKAVLINPLDTDLQIALAYRRAILGQTGEAISSMATLAEQQPDDLSVQMDYVELLTLVGNDIEAQKVNKRILHDHPNLLRSIFSGLYTHLRLHEPDVAEQYLKRVEAISPERAYDDRYTFCKLTGNRPCFEEYGRRYLIHLQTSGANLSADPLEVEYAVMTGNPEQAMQLLSSRIELLLENDGFFGPFIPQWALAIAFDQTGRQQEFDHLLAEIEKRVQLKLANGIWPNLVAKDLLNLASVRGDAKLAAERLAVAIDSNASPSTAVLKFEIVYDKVRDDPAFQSQVDRLWKIEEKTREQLHAEGIW
jgi:TolB-like protein/tetratricopeptide (TPR) repeat protein